ncbi:glycoside hydrolase family 3 domain protein [Methanolacinia petrolearia DSM 11571]|uniref:beta-N-acetylhexosaminidase n=1 Tax=Methanolacinia petrolearia (strain DSM 11571 / OCM 486 / SEBR 4847) TaxID=679926 RepID=E1RG55_METP4|nr:glycoside hydrolase family 3 protein [Methanolacinia petrolearia]ADN36290.1 glycoside hydrolase family 3 domain protein [Methanolacinia petrolearia DSM 11571]
MKGDLFFVFVLLCLVAVFLAAGCTGNSQYNEQIQAPDDPVTYESADECIVPDATLDEKIGQMILVGFRGFTADNDSQIADDIRNGRVGGVILFDRDVALNSSERNIKSPEQVFSLNGQLKGYAENIPLFISVDQEGGKICRLKESYGFPAVPSAEYLGSMDNETVTRDAGSILADTVKDAGFNMNFAPVVDLMVNPDSPAIGKLNRSFSEDPVVVVRNAGWIIDEHQEAGIITAIKHFPGHGSAMADSHAGFTDVTDTWSEEELIPYQILIDEGIPDIVMTAHIYNRNLDPDYPATLSEKTITGVLRDRLGYDGVVITDAMDMGAISDNYGIKEALNLSINAGCDIILFANNIVYDERIAENATGLIKELVLDGEIPEERINESYERIIRLKMKYLGCE